MQIADVYNVIIEKKLTLEKASIAFDTPLSTLRYHLIKFCKENNLEMFKCKPGRKAKIREFRLVNNL